MSPEGPSDEDSTDYDGVIRTGGANPAFLLVEAST
jgi:hypothetical protein